jgi:hypothetical protein
VAQRVAGHVEHRQFQRQARYLDAVAFAQRMRHRRDAVLARTEHRHRILCKQLRHATDMVSMVMGE